MWYLTNTQLCPIAGVPKVWVGTPGALQGREGGVAR